MTEQQHKELVELIEDSVQFYCSENLVSGETAYKVLECLSIAKQQEFK